MQRALTVARNMDFLVTALGTPASLDSIPIWNNNWHSIFPTTRREDIAGYIYGRPYDENGNILNIQNSVKEDLTAKQLLQGIWVNDETEMPLSMFHHLNLNIFFSLYLSRNDC